MKAARGHFAEWAGIVQGKSVPACPSGIKALFGAVPANGFGNSENIGGVNGVQPVQRGIGGHEEAVPSTVPADHPVQGQPSKLAAQQDMSGADRVERCRAYTNDIAVADQRIHARAVRGKADRGLLPDQCANDIPMARRLVLCCWSFRLHHVVRTRITGYGTLAMVILSWGHKFSPESVIASGRCLWHTAGP